jgi:hypothetical protein
MRTSWPRCFSLTATLDAAPLLVSTSGMFSSSTPTGPFSGPNVPWTLSFAIDTNSSVSASSPDSFFSRLFPRPRAAARGFVGQNIFAERGNAYELSFIRLRNRRSRGLTRQPTK